jgi:hypothetical protein
MNVLLVLLLVAASAVSGQPARPPQPEPIPAPPDVAKPPADAAKTTSGLASKVLQPGTGSAKPTADDFVTVHYTGWTTDGKMFDSSYARNSASTFPVNRVIKGWGEGVQLMIVGEKRRLWIPQELAYAGQTGRPRDRALLRLDDGREAVRQLVDARTDRQLRPDRCHPRLDRRPPVDGAG